MNEMNRYVNQTATGATQVALDEGIAVAPAVGTREIDPDRAARHVWEVPAGHRRIEEIPVDITIEHVFDSTTSHQVMQPVSEEFPPGSERFHPS